MNNISEPDKLVNIYKPEPYIQSSRWQNETVRQFELCKKEQSKILEKDKEIQMKQNIEKLKLLKKTQNLNKDIEFIDKRRYIQLDRRAQMPKIKLEIDYKMINSKIEYFCKWSKFRTKRAEAIDGYIAVKKR